MNNLLETLAISLSSHGKEAVRIADFAGDFRGLSKGLAGSYSVNPDIYSQKASLERFGTFSAVPSDEDKPVSGDGRGKYRNLNSAAEFLRFVNQDSDSQGRIVDAWSSEHHTSQPHLAMGRPVLLGDVSLDSLSLERRDPDSNPHGRIPTIETLLKRAARLEALDVDTAVPPVYATARGEVAGGLRLLQEAAKIAYDWSESRNALTPELALEKARHKLGTAWLKRGVLVGALALAGCSLRVSPSISSTPDGVGGNTPSSSEVNSATVVPSAAATEIPTFTSTEMPSPTPGGPVGFEVTSTPAGGTGMPGSVVETLTPNPPTSTPEASTEVIRPPTVQEMRKLDAGGAIPDYAQPYYDALTAEIPRIAKQLKVKTSDVSVHIVNNGLAGQSFRWGGWISIDGQGVAWPVDANGVLSPYPASYKPTDPLKPEGAVTFDDKAFTWSLVGSSGDQMGFAGTKPMIMGGLGTAMVDGKKVDTFGQYLLPGGVSPELAAQLDSAVWQRLDAITEIKSYPICKIENYDKCVIPVEDLLNGDYLKWLETLSQPFDATNLKQVPFVFLQEQEGNLIVYDMTHTPNFSDPATRPFRRDVTSGVAYVTYDGVQVPYLIRPIEFYDPKDPTHNKWVITLKSYYGSINPVTGQYTPIPNVSAFVKEDIAMWKSSMNTTPILTSPVVQISNSVDPLIQKVFDANPDIQQWFKDFESGADMGALSRGGVLVLTEDYSGGSIYK